LPVTPCYAKFIAHFAFYCGFVEFVDSWNTLFFGVFK
jgi:hypothetical protein